jgi:Holliday junction resolvasome RuvABC endonuclease subunit
MMEDSGEVIAYATFAADNPHCDRQLRAWDLAESLYDWCDESTHFNRLTGERVLVIEKPIVGKNIENFEKQMRVFTAIISLFRRKVSSIVEVSPTRMKKAVTGNGAAKKIDIINASPFDGPGEWVGEDALTPAQKRDDAQANQEAVADAWGIGICAVKKVWDEKYAPHPNSFAARGPIIERLY